MNVPREIAETIAGARRVLVATHVPPDGDGLGTGLALVRVLAAEGVPAILAVGGPVQACLRFLISPGEVDDTPEGPDGDFDLAVVLDAATFKRLGPLEPRVRAAGRILNIDHHERNDRFGDLNWVDGTSPAVGEMLYRLLKATGRRITPDLALPLYVALVTDTGRFGYSNTNSATHLMAAELLSAGVRPEEVTNHIYRSLDPGFLKLSGHIQLALETAAEGLVAHVTVTPGMVRDAGADPMDVGDIIDLLISLAGVEVAVLFREGRGGHGTKVSLRSRRWFPVNEFAARFGGGGHPRAAGISLDGPLDLAAGELLPALTAEVARGRPEEED